MLDLQALMWLKSSPVRITQQEACYVAQSSSFPAQAPLSTLAVSLQKPEPENKHRATLVIVQWNRMKQDRKRSSMPIKSQASEWVCCLVEGPQAPAPRDAMPLSMMTI